RGRRSAAARAARWPRARCAPRRGRPRPRGSTAGPCGKDVSHFRGGTVGQPDDRNFATIWEGLADALGDRPAVRQGASTLTWAEGDDAASRVAGWLESEGIGEGDHVALVTYNCPEMFTVVFAAFKLRAVPVAFNYRYLANEVAEVL